MSKIVKKKYDSVTAAVFRDGELPEKVVVCCTPFYVQHTEEEWKMLEDNWHRCFIVGNMTMAEAQKRFYEFANVVRI